MPLSRRPIKSRKARWAAAAASFLAKHEVEPNTISVMSAVFALGAGCCLYMTRGASDGFAPWLFVCAAALIQLRLICNLLDGMVAVEGGRKTKSGEIFNELPDRFSDAFILIGAGYSSSLSATGWAPWLGWCSAALAILTAYVRALGASAGASQQFCGPMAKPHRMAVLTFACLGAAAMSLANYTFPIMAWALGVVAVGCAITVFRRTIRIVHELESK